MLWFLVRCQWTRKKTHWSLAGIVYSWDYDGIWSSSIPQLSFLIKENVLGKRFRSCSSSQGPRISPLAWEYGCPQPSLSIITPVLEQPTNRTEVLCYYSMLTYSRRKACFEHSNFLKVNESLVIRPQWSGHMICDKFWPMNDQCSNEAAPKRHRPEIQLRAF